MIEIEFRKTELKDQELIQGYFDRYPSRSCERTFTNVYLWARFYRVTFAVVEDTLVFRNETEDGYAFTFPAGSKENVKKAIEVLEQYCQERQQPFAMYCVTPDQFAWIEEVFPGKYQIEYNEDIADYVYESEKLATLSGKKLHGKRNHVNKFKIVYEGRWNYEPICKENLEECFQMALKWRNANGCEDDEDKNAEICVTMNSLRLFEELKLIGGILRIDGEIVAFTIGEPINEDTFVVHIEKAFSDVPGAYNMINQQFVQNELMAYPYINREEDTGAEGLRKAKRSYRPVFMVEKGFVTKK